MATTTNDIERIVSENLIKLRDSKGMTVRDMRHSGITERAIATILNREASTKITNIEKLAKFFGISYFKLFLSNIDIDELQSEDLDHLIMYYLQSSKAGKEALLYNAKREAYLNMVISMPNTTNQP